MQRRYAKDGEGQDRAPAMRDRVSGASPSAVAARDFPPVFAAGNRAIANLFSGRSGGGNPLPASVRLEFETQLGAPLSQVRVHTDSAAAADAARLDADAFTVGSDVYFAQGRYAVGDSHGRALLGHELTHVVQQTHGAPTAGPLRLTRPTDTSERTAAAIGRAAGSGAGTVPIARMAPEVARQQTTAAGAVSPAERVGRLVADSDHVAIRQITEEELAASTPTQRAGMIRVLVDLTWTREADEWAVVRLLGYRGEQQQVTAVLDTLGRRQALLDSIDDEALHSQTVRLLGSAPTAGTGEFDAALTSGQPKEVMAIQSFASATDEQRLGLLRILLDMASSNTDEEAKMLDILAAGSGAGSLVGQLTATGLKQRLFDHIYAAKNKEQLTKLLRPLHDPQLDADLAVFNQGFVAGAVTSLLEGAKSAWAQFSFGGLISGVLQPILHPIDAAQEVLQELLDFCEALSWDGLVTVARDAVGTLAMWVTTLAALTSGFALALAMTGALIPAGVPIGVIAASLWADAAALGLLFLVLTGVKLVLDVGQAGAATTAREREREQEQVGQDETVLVVAGALKLIFSGMARVVRRFRGAAESPEQAEPEALKKTGEAADEASKDVTQNAKQLKEQTNREESPPNEGGGAKEPGQQPADADSLGKQADEAKNTQAKAAEEANKYTDAGHKKQGGAGLTPTPGPLAVPKPEPAPAAAPVATSIDGYESMSTMKLKSLARTDPAAADALWNRYLQYVKTATGRRRLQALKRRGDTLAGRVLEEHVWPNERLPEFKGPKGDERMPHSAKAVIRDRHGKVRSPREYESGKDAPEQTQNEAHTEAKATKDAEPELMPGETLQIAGQYDPCLPCQKAMQVLSKGGKTVEYWWQGGFFRAVDGKVVEFPTVESTDVINPSL